MKKYFLFVFVILIAANGALFAKKHVPSNSSNYEKNLPELSEMSTNDWRILKAFTAIVVSADDIEDRDRDSLFDITGGYIYKKERHDVDFYTAENLSLMKNGRKPYPFAENLNGTFSYDDDAGIIYADMTGSFPHLDGRTHTFKFNVSEDSPSMIIVELNNQKYAIKSNNYRLTLGAYEMIIEDLIF